MVKLEFRRYEKHKSGPHANVSAPLETIQGELEALKDITLKVISGIASDEESNNHMGEWITYSDKVQSLLEAGWTH